jgi:Gas vesicle synthesis protein GvpO
MQTRDDGRGAAGARERSRRDDRERDERRDTERRNSDRRRRPAGQDRPIEPRSEDDDRELEPVAEEEEEQGGSRATSARLPALQAAKAGMRQLAMVTGREPQGVVSLVPEEDGWRIGIEIVEDRRIPSSTDVIGLYEALVDDDGELTGYSRKRRYSRGKGDAGE